MGRILIVDDERGIRLTLQEFLTQAGHEVHTAATADEAIEHMSRLDFEVMVTDIIMPGRNGVELLQHIRQSHPQTKVLLMTGEPTVDTAAEAVRSGAFDYIPKPIRKNGILRAVSTALMAWKLDDENRKLHEENERYRAHLEQMVARRTAALRRRTQALVGILRVVRDMNRSPDTSHLYHSVFESARKAMPVDAACVSRMVDPISGCQDAAWWTDGQNTIVYPAGSQELANYSVHQEAGILACPRGLPDESLEHCPGLCTLQVSTRVRSMLVTPLRLAGNQIGTIYVCSFQANAYTSSHLRFLNAISAPLASAIHRAELLGQARREVELRTQAEDNLLRLNAELDRKVAARTAELQAANRELDSFVYSVSHDLRAPLRVVNGYADALQKEYASVLPGQGQHLLKRLSASAIRMDQLVKDLLQFARVSKIASNTAMADMSNMAHKAVDDLRSEFGTRNVSITIGDLPPCQADLSLMQQVWANLISNALKYSQFRDPAVIDISASQVDGEMVYCVRDNGAGFDMQYADRLFGVFQRLHSQAEFEGTGVGLATVRRILERHRGRIWAQAAPDSGAAFYFTVAPADISPPAGPLCREGEAPAAPASEN